MSDKPKPEGYHGPIMLKKDLQKERTVHEEYRDGRLCNKPPIPEDYHGVTPDMLKALNILIAWIQEDRYNSATIHWADHKIKKVERKQETKI